VSGEHDKYKSWLVSHGNWEATFLANRGWPDISMAVHQFAHFCSNLKAINYLEVTRTGSFPFGWESLL
jgi:hypothetical protein